MASQENLQALSLGGGSSSLGAGVSTAAGAAAAAPAAAGGTAAGSGQSQEVQQPAQGREEEAAGATNAGAAAAGTDGGDGAGGAGGEGTGANAQLGAETPVLGGRHSRHKLYKVRPALTRTVLLDAAFECWCEKLCMRVASWLAAACLGLQPGLR